MVWLSWLCRPACLSYLLLGGGGIFQKLLGGGFEKLLENHCPIETIYR